MNHVFNLTSKALGQRFQKLGWQTYKGHVEDFQREQMQILDENGSLKKEYIGMKGYPKYTKKYHQEGMEKAFQNVSAVLGGYWGMKKMNLQWKQFKGSVSEYYKLRQLFENYSATDFEGLKGQREVANKIFKGHTRRTYTNVSILREILFGSRKAFNELKWSINLK